MNSLGESEEKYRRQFEEALDAIFVADAETGILVDCNPAACELAGQSEIRNSWHAPANSSSSRRKRRRIQ